MNEALTLRDFLDAWELFRDPALAGALAGVLLGWLGVYIVARRMVFMSAALSQFAGLGVTLSFYGALHLGVTGPLASPTVGAMVATLAAAGLPLLGRGQGGARRDRLLGLIWLVGAAGSLAVGTRIVQELQDVHTLLFGSAVVVLPEHLLLLQVTAAVLLGLHLWWRRGFVRVVLDADGAAVAGLPVLLLEGALMLSLALAISVCTRVLGALPSFAFSVLPAMAALRLCSSVHRALIWSAIFGGVAGLGGYVVAFLYQLPVGASQTLLAAALVVLAEIARLLLHSRQTRARLGA